MHADTNTIATNYNVTILTSTKLNFQLEHDLQRCRFTLRTQNTELPELQKQLLIVLI